MLRLLLLLLFSPTAAIISTACVAYSAAVDVAFAVVSYVDVATVALVVAAFCYSAVCEFCC